MNGKGPPVIPLLFLPNNKSGNGESAYLDQPALQGVILSYRPHIPENYGIYIPDLLVVSFNIIRTFLFKEISDISRINDKKKDSKG